ncbi:MAG: cyclopropane-fatty-acyl-phospholipid synthase family protein, partial [Litorimonas sp.]
LEHGTLTVTTPDGQKQEFEGRQPGVNASIHVHDWRVMSNLAMRGDVGFAEDYRQGLWDTDNLENLIQLGLENDHVVSTYIFGNVLANLKERILYMLRMNTVRNSRHNIHAHYDLGNDFYKLWLDPTMTYSSALFESGTETLEQAQDKKYDRIIDQLDTPSGRVLEVGCGWGGFAERSLERGDYAIKGITLSDQQHDYAKSRLGNAVDISLEDYRHQHGKYDRIVSIEMFEAVGERFWPTYFQKLGGLLKTNGKAVVQTITIDEQHFEKYRRTGDAIRSFIFPGGMLPSPTRFAEEAAKSGMKVKDTFHFGQDYAKTLSLWLKNFDGKINEVKNLGFDDGFIRLWRFYLAACIAGFKTGRTDVMQVELAHA